MVSEVEGDGLDNGNHIRKGSFRVGWVIELGCNALGSIWWGGRKRSSITSNTGMKYDQVEIGAVIVNKQLHQQSLWMIVWWGLNLIEVKQISQII